MTAVSERPAKIHPLVEKYLRLERMPHMACPGCGIGNVIHCVLQVMDDLQLNPQNTVWVQGVGCSSRITYSRYKGDNIDAHHGRIYGVATGLKMARPDMNFILFTGDGDSGAIGGNHFIHACRRNLDVTALMFNNGIYGMTGGQVAPTTPRGGTTTTTPYGSLEDTFDMCNLAEAAGATYVARWTSLPKHYGQVVKSIKAGIENKGFSYIEVVVPCTTQFGRYVLKTEEMPKNIQWIEDHTVTLSQAEKLSIEEREGKMLLGEFVRRERTGVVQRYMEMIERMGGRQ
ncbi:MAG TPA: thiamine pyrophosphate-dependent enzyme [Chloroflexota bacterium]|nr:thiamine pyrophosphate-dependent enzyme [Chloroflexota bacterium]